MWIRLEDGLYLFGEHGINRIDIKHAYNDGGEKVECGSDLYRDTKLIAVTTATVDRIQELLAEAAACE